MNAQARNPAVVCLLVAALLLLADQATKLAALAWLEPGRPVPVMPFVNLTLAFNPGAAFSFLGDAGGWQRWLFTAIGVLAVVAISVWLWRSRSASRIERAALTLVLSGAAGNLVDRARLGVVVDFVDVYVRQWHWPVFNVADSAICIGVALLLWVTLRPPATEQDQA